MLPALARVAFSPAGSFMLGVFSVPIARAAGSGLRYATKSVLKAGMYAKEQGGRLKDEIQEELQDIQAEVKAGGSEAAAAASKPAGKKAS